MPSSSPGYHRFGRPQGCTGDEAATDRCGSVPETGHTHMRYVAFSLSLSLSLSPHMAWPVSARYSAVRGQALLGKPSGGGCGRPLLLPSFSR